MWHAANGQRGLVAKAEYKRQMAALAGELADLQAQKMRWALRVGLIRGEAIDRDILEEEARLILDRVDKRDLAVFLPAR